MSTSDGKSTWRFPASFWVANGIELFERAAYYGTFIALADFLTTVVGYRDKFANSIAAVFAAGLYLLPLFNGAIADRIGFRRALLLAFALLSGGYALLGAVPERIPVLLALLLVMVGGAFVKPIISGTVAKTSDAHNRARAYSLFYMMVNIGAFSGKTVAAPVRKRLGRRFVPLYSAAAAAIALVLVALFYRPARDAVSDGESKPVRRAREVAAELLTVLGNSRFLALVLITAGFWAIQGQLYYSMPKYVLRMVGEHASPEWYANVNPFVVVVLVVPITQLVRRIKPFTSIGIALGLIPCSALAMALSPQLGVTPMTIAGIEVHPITVMMVAGIAVQGISECFLSPRYLEFASRQAPAGQEGLYMGYSHLNTFFAWLGSGILSGFLLEAYCPDPALLPPETRAAYQQAIASGNQLPAAYANAHVIWYVFAGIGAAAFCALVIFQLLASSDDDPGDH